jgi:molybdenum cofactor biosynthesis enzyme MoaA
MLDLTGLKINPVFLQQINKLKIPEMLRLIAHKPRPCGNCPLYTLKQLPAGMDASFTKQVA